MNRTQYGQQAIIAMNQLDTRDVISSSVYNVWDCMNARLVKERKRSENRMRKVRRHVVLLEKKLAERNSEYVRDITVAIILTQDKERILAITTEHGNIGLPSCANSEATASEALTVLAEDWNVEMFPPFEFAVQRSAAEDTGFGFATRTIYMVAFDAETGNKQKLPPNVKWHDVNAIIDKLLPNEQIALKAFLDLK